MCLKFSLNWALENIQAIQMNAILKFHYSFATIFRKGYSLFLYVKVLPGSNTTRIAKITSEEIVIELSEPAENNRANIELTEFLEECLNL